MATLLHIDSSARDGSFSRQLSSAFVQSFVEALPGTQVVRRDLVVTPPPFVDAAFLANAFLPPDQRQPGALATSDALTAEFVAADVVVVGMPMYNWGVPAIVKAWIDQIVRAGLTFSMGSDGLKGLVNPDKQVVALVSRNGGFLPGEPFAQANFQDGHFDGVMKFMGVRETRLEALQDIFNPATLADNLAKSLARSRELAKEAAAKLA